MMLLSIRCINPGELLLLLSTKVYLERLAVLTSFVSPELKSFRIENRVFKKQEKMYYPRFTKAIIHHFLIQDKTLSWRNKIRMHISKDEYLISTLRFVSANESTQIYEAILPECLTSPAMKESKAYKTYLGYATGIVIREPPMETKSKRKEKVDVTRGKGIELLSDVSLTEEAQMKEVRKKSLRDFHKLHPSGFGTIAKKPQRVDKITLPVTSKGTDNSSDENDSKNEGNDEENKSNDDKTPFDGEKGSDSEQDSNGSESDSKSNQQEYDDDEVKDDDDDDDDKFEDAHVTITTIAKETKVPDASGSHSSDLASKFLKFSDIPPNDAEIVSLLDDHVHHKVPRIHTSTLLTVPISVIPEASPACTTIPQSSQTFTSSPLQTTPTPPPIIETTNIPPSILDFASVFQFNDSVIALEKDVNLAKASSQLQSTYKAASTLTEFELKKILIDKMNSSESYLIALEHQECYDGLIKSYNLDKDFFSSYDVYSLKRSRQDKDKDEGPCAGSD
nr:hypothetical protein [Tanacetum cinerariifolium]